mgnify:CR=1 FL=1
MNKFITLKHKPAIWFPALVFISLISTTSLSHAGARKLSRIPPRSAIVAFSAEQVYAIAEMLRRFRGGAAVVMGALSPETRNKQVAMFQAGEVDYIVATDAILTKAHCTRLATAAHDGYARALVPAHTPMDGDLIFAASTGRLPLEAPVADTLYLGHAAACVMARAIARAIRAAKALPGDLQPSYSHQHG